MNMVIHVATGRRSESLAKSAVYRVPRKTRPLFSPLNISTLHPSHSTILKTQSRKLEALSK
jgi:hypothetical protein